MSRAEVWLKRSLKFLLVFLGVLVFLSVPSIDYKERVDKGFVYKKQVIVNVVNNKEERIYFLGLQDPVNADEKGVLEVDSYTYSLYSLGSYYPYNLWEVTGELK